MNNKDLQVDYGLFLFHLVLCFILLVATIIGMIRKDEYGAMMCFIGFWGSRVILELNR